MIISISLYTRVHRTLLEVLIIYLMFGRLMLQDFSTTQVEHIFGVTYRLDFVSPIFGKKRI